MTARDEYFAALASIAESSIGAPLDGRTVVCPDPERAGGRTATSYPTPAGTVVFCDPDVAARVAEALGPDAEEAVTTDRWVDLATSAGAEHLGSGHNRVLVGDIVHPGTPDDGIEVRVLDAHSDADMAILKVFADGCTEDDLDEADIDLDEPDPLMVGLFDGDTMAAYASGRPYDDTPDFDDIGVLTSTEYRRRGLGARAVAEFVERRVASDPTRRMLYRCDVENAGSNGVAESLGFTLAHTIGAVRFPE